MIIMSITTFGVKSHKKAYCGMGFFAIYILIAYIIGYAISGTEYGLSLLLFSVITIGVFGISTLMGSFWFLFNLENLEIAYVEVLTYCAIDSSITTLAFFYPIVIIGSLFNLILILAFSTIIGVKINEGLNSMIEAIRKRFKK